MLSWTCRWSSGCGTAIYRNWSLVWRLSVAAAFVSSLLVAGEDRIVEPLDSNRTVIVKGHLHPKAQSQYDQGPVDPSLELSYVTLLLTPSPSLEPFLREQQNPASPDFHRWLTPEQFADRFGLSNNDITQLVSWLRSKGLRVHDVARGRHWITFSGTAEQAARAFRTEFHRYSVDGEMHVSNANEPSVPAAFENVVSGFRGLNDFRMRSAAIVRQRFPAGSETPDFNAGSGIHYLVPDDIATIYDIAPLYKASVDGSGMKIAVIGRTAIDLADVRAFRKRYQLPARDPQVVLFGQDPGISAGDLGEADLDIEWSGAVARNATIIYVYAGSVDIAAQYAIDRNLAPVMSFSYGQCEPETIPASQSVAQQANAQGITWLAASGDAAAGGCNASASQATRGLAVNFPSSIPEITSVGGSEFNEGPGKYWAASNSATGASALSYIPEEAWNDTASMNMLEGTGGGASIFFTKPLWQTGPGVPNDGARDVPDVSLASSPEHDGYFIFTGGGLAIVGGTSIATPIAAGVIALLNQSLVSKGVQTQPGLGNINPVLYRLAQTTTDVFHDIKKGDNIVPCAQSTPNCSTSSLGYNTGPGYDLATGLGSFDVNHLVTEWSNGTTASATTLTATPANLSLNHGSVQLVANVSATGGITPSGTVSFVANDAALGTVPLTLSGGVASANLTIDVAQLSVGANSVHALYSGNNTLSGSVGSAAVTVNLPSAASAVVPSIDPNPVPRTPPDQGFTYVFTITLTEKAGVGTTLTSCTIDGSDITSLFNSTSIPPKGTISTSVGGNLQGTHVFNFAGMDAGGQTWSHQLTVQFLASTLVFPSITLSSTPVNVLRNPAADPSCQWSQQLTLEEDSGFSVALTDFTADNAQIHSTIQQVFGTTRLAPFGRLQGTLCWSGLNAPATKNLEIDGTTDRGDAVSTTLSASYGSPAPAAIAFSASPASVAIKGSGSASVALNFTGGAPAWTVSILPANRTTTWLSVPPLSGTGPAKLSIQTSSSGLAKGVYSAVLAIQSEQAIPQVINVTATLVVGASSSISIGGIANGASFKTGFAPGMLISVFGTGLAPSSQSASILPLPLSMAGVSATINNVTAPLYFVSAGQLNLQIPYETGAGIAVLGVNNNGKVASFSFPVTLASPGIFVTSDGSSSLVPFASGQPGQILLAFITGEGDVTPTLATGQSPSPDSSLSDLPHSRLPLTITVGGKQATTQFKGIPPGLVGVTQINFTVPADAPPGVQPVVVTVGGVSSPPANLKVTLPSTATLGR